ncbi:MAG: M28 family peptidase [Candidatus Helarchaeota archaeon]
MTYTEENAKHAYEFTAKLAFPRLVGSDGERKAQNILEIELNEIGNPFFEEELQASTFPINILFRVISPIGAAILFGAWVFSDALFGLQLPLLALFFSLGGIFWILSSSSILNWSFGRIPNISTVYSTKNFISEIRPLNSKGHLIYVAHYDSKSQTYPALVRVILFIGGLISGILYGVRVAGGAIINMIGISPTGFWNPQWISFSIMFIWNFLLIFNALSNKSPGAVDNATSVATILELSRLFKSNPLKHVKLTFLITAAEELGLYGAADFINRHKDELNKEHTYFINLDGIGCGKTLILTSYGIPLKKTSQFLNDLIFEIVEEQGIQDDFGTIFLPIGAATDHVPIQKAGFEVTVLVSKGLTMGVHTSKDTIKHVTVPSLKTAGLIGYELAQKLNQNFKN